MPNILFFDTETTGFPTRKLDRIDPEYTDSDAWETCRMVEIAWSIYESKTKTLVKQNSFLVKPVYEKKDKDASDIHTLTYEYLSEHGISISTVLREFMKDLKIHEIDLVIAHNIAFDQGVVLSEMHRLQGFEDMIQIFLNKEKYCTMTNNKSSSGKFIRLADLYLLKTGIEMHIKYQAHRAKDDTEACASIYFANPC
jgi:hypothetical protein